jgi:hypothetical protein
MLGYLAGLDSPGANMTAMQGVCLVILLLMPSVLFVSYNVYRHRDADWIRKYRSAVHRSATYRSP